MRRWACPTWSPAYWLGTTAPCSPTGKRARVRAWPFGMTYACTDARVVRLPGGSGARDASRPSGVRTAFIERARVASTGSRVSCSQRARTRNHSMSSQAEETSPLSLKPIRNGTVYERRQKISTLVCTFFRPSCVQTTRLTNESEVSFPSNRRISAYVRVVVLGVLRRAVFWA